MIWLFGHDEAMAYRDVWCSDEMRQNNPEGCGIGLAIGYVWFPALLLLTVATFGYLIVHACKAFRNRRR